MNIIHHYPPELKALLIDAIARLIKGKQDVLNFFRGCGVAPSVYVDLQQIVRQNRESIKKVEIVRQLINRLNDQGELTLMARREILRQVTQWDDFSTCYDSDRMEAEGLVAKIQKLVNVKDSFTRMNLERERERQEKARLHEAEAASIQRTLREREQIKADLFSLFGESNAQKRGTALEGVLNRLFESHGMAIRDSFRRVGEPGEGVVEQIDGVVSLDGELYLVEMKWWSKPLDVGEVSHHLIRIYHRAAARGILISQSGYTPAALKVCRDALNHGVCALAHLSEFVLLLERNSSLPDLLRRKIQAAIVDKEPFVQPL
jgi:restriction system protein